MSRDFNGTTQRLTASAPVTTFPFSVSLWFNADDITFGAADKYIWTVADTAGTGNYFSIFLLDSNSRLQAVYNANGIFRRNQSAGAVSTGVWNHAVAVFTSSTDIQIYLNNVAGTNVQAGNGTPSSIDTESIGALVRSSLVAFFDGKAAEVGVWNQSLSLGDIAQLYAGARPDMVQANALVAYQPLLGRASPEPDLVGGFNLTVTNAPTQSDHPRILHRRSQMFASKAAAGGATITGPLIGNGHLMGQGPLIGGRLAA